MIEHNLGLVKYRNLKHISPLKSETVSELARFASVLYSLPAGKQLSEQLAYLPGD